jgi:prepilin-type N-terminal cleavage/methylation domain-containing protein
MKSSQGLTLIELMTAIALMAMLSAVAIPNIVSMLPKQRLGESAREILSILHFEKYPRSKRIQMSSSISTRAAVIASFLWMTVRGAAARNEFTVSLL